MKFLSEYKEYLKFVTIKINHSPMTHIECPKIIGVLV